MRRWLPTVLGVVVLTTGFWYLLNSKQTYAATTDYMSQCTNTYMGDWDWPAYMRQSWSSGVTNGGADSTFNPATDSYLIISQFGGQFLNNNLYLYYADSGYKITVNEETVSSIVRMTIRSLNNVGAVGTVHKVSVESTPKSDPTIKAFYGSLTSRTTTLSPAPPDWFYIHTPQSPSQPVLDTPSTASLTSTNQCVYAGKNLRYDSSFLAKYNAFSTHVEWTANTGTTCSALNVGCWISKALDGISNAFIDLFTAMGHFIGNLFIPNGDDISASFDDFNTFMSDKLGFLVYPFDFFGDVFNAFDGTTTGCSRYSCVKSFGTFYGGAATLDFSAPAKVNHATMDFILLAIQGITVLAVLYAVYHKYLKIVSHGAA